MDIGLWVVSTLTRETRTPHPRAPPPAMSAASASSKPKAPTGTPAADATSKLATGISDAVIAALNLRFEERDRQAAQVAAEMLEQLGILTTKLETLSLVAPKRATKVTTGSGAAKAPRSSGKNVANGEVAINNNMQYWKHSHTIDPELRERLLTPELLELVSEEKSVKDKRDPDERKRAEAHAVWGKFSKETKEIVKASFLEWKAQANRDVAEPQLDAADGADNDNGDIADE